MQPQRHSHPVYMHWCKDILAALAFVYPPYLLLTSNPKSTLIGIIEIIVAFIMMISILVAAYFWQDIWIDEKGLLVEFLWRKIRVQWADLIEAKPAWGFLGQESKRPVIVLANGLTPFHRAFGVVYAFSIKPAFVISPSISDFQILKETIQLHIKQ